MGIRPLAEEVLYGELPHRSAEAVIAAVERSRGAPVTLVSTLQGTMGAWIVRLESGDECVLKVASVYDQRDDVAICGRLAALVDTPACRAPAYIEIGHAPAIGTWYLQQRIAGVSAQVLSPALALAALDLIDRGAAAAPYGAYPYAAHTATALGDDEFGWAQRVAPVSAEGAALVHRARSVAVPASAGARSHDVIHGDLALGNLLVSDIGVLNGCVDWDLAGRGDRILDQTRLLYAWHHAAASGEVADPVARRLIVARIMEASGAHQLTVHCAYWALMVADWAVRRAPSATAELIRVGMTVLDDVRSAADG